MKNLILTMALLFCIYSNSQTPTSTMKGYYLQKVGDSVVGQNSRPDKAFFDLYNYMKERGIKKGVVTSPYWEINIDYPDMTIVEPPIEEPKDTIVSPPIETGNIYEFNKTQWNIVEGIVSDEFALNNKIQIQKAIDYAKLNGYDGLKIDSLDAYFTASGGWGSSIDHDKRAIKIPSDFIFEMTDNTYLRVQPNHWAKNTFISVLQKQNVTIQGGHLIGDRYTHDYSPIKDNDGIPRDTHEWAGLIIIAASQNILIDGVSMEESTGDGLIIGSIGLRTIYKDVPWNNNILVNNCIVKTSRRNNISITDGENISIINSQILEAGKGDLVRDAENNIIFTSAGVMPRAGIDVEPYYGWDENGSFRFYERVENVLIKGCNILDNASVGVNNYTGQGVVVQDNICDTGFSAYHDIGGTKFINNTLIARESSRKNTGITLGGFKINVNGLPNEFSIDSEVKGNTIKGFVFGIKTAGKNPTISNNTIEDFEIGIIVDANGLVCESNTVTSNRVSYANAMHTRAYINNGNFYFNNNILKSPRVVISLDRVNQGGTDITVFNGNIIESFEKRDFEFKNSDNIVFNFNTLKNTKPLVTNCLNYVSENNTTLTE